MRLFHDDVRPRLTGALIIAGLLSCLALLAQANETHAQESPNLPSVPAELRGAYDTILRNPGDLEAFWALAQDAEQRGLDEFAIRLYERMLLLDPRLAQARLRLAQLLIQRGALLTARAYLEEALAEEAMPPEARRRAEEYVAEIDAQRSRHRLGGVARVGVRYASNPAAVTDALDDTNDLNDAEVRGLRSQKSDQSAFASLDARHTYDFLTQLGDQLESHIFLYGEKQRRADEADLALAELDVGPRLAIMAPVDERSWRPYAVGRIIGLENSLFSAEGGGGVEGLVALSPRLAAFGSFEVVYAGHNNFRMGGGGDPPGSEPSDFENEDFDGFRFEGELGVSSALTPWLRGQLIGFGGSVDAEKDYRNNDYIGVRAGLTASYPAPFQLSALPWSTTLSGSYRYARFSNSSQANPIEDGDPPIGRRKEDRWQASLTNQVPLSPRWALELRLAHTQLGSSIDGADYDNSEASLAVVYAFGR